MDWFLYDNGLRLGRVNIVLIGFFWMIFITIYLPFCLLINIGHFADLEVYPVPLYFFVRTSKNLMRFGILFLKIFSFKMFLPCSYFFTKNAYILTTIITFDINNFSNFYMSCKYQTILCKLEALFGV